MTENDDNINVKVCYTSQLLRVEAVSRARRAPLRVWIQWS
jgi:hypothetical protein